MKWQKLLIKITFWFIAEVLLNIFGMDDLADYSEFVFEHRHTHISNVARLNDSS